jgi:two-component system, chemotaxis family, response regulator Rcp1
MLNLVPLPTISICDKPVKIETSKADEYGQAVHGGSGILVHVLLVEDNPEDVRLTQEAFRDINSSVQLHVATTGVEAMAFLRQQEPYVDAPRPDLVLLDLTLPEMSGSLDGREILALIKEDKGLKSIPTVILTASQENADSVKCYQLHANAYVPKPMHYEAFRSLVRNVNELWLTEFALSKKKNEKAKDLAL